MIPVGDILIREVPDEVVASLEERAKRLGISRSEYLRRTLAAAAQGANIAVAPQDLQRFSDTFAELGDPGVMSQAWD